MVRFRVAGMWCSPASLDSLSILFICPSIIHRCLGDTGVDALFDPLCSFTFSSLSHHLISFSSAKHSSISS
ncbi:hypothetical protein BU16DRAFT_332313 [Lophium mytilinum]|uniref:Uncharacterized protein n=1 Tax=Lophium mytilinum TaxID=390894 RepID=A0A6A6R0J7_9PEZI|nr:hypothetical protein BU16DRAFT_332313 [Lophium mytilinum]